MGPGAGNFEILQVLSWAVSHDENPVVVATRRIGRPAEILEAIEAANELEQWAEQSAEEVIEDIRMADDPDFGRHVAWIR